jgi:hypothetical protein
MNEQSKPTFKFWATIIFVAAVPVYFLSFGPWLLVRPNEELPQSVVDKVDWLYTPAYCALLDGPDWVRSCYESYLDLWRGPVEPIHCGYDVAPIDPSPPAVTSPSLD